MQHEGVHYTPVRCSIGRADWVCRAFVSDNAEANQQPQLTAQEAMPVQVPNDMSLAIFESQYPHNWKRYAVLCVNGRFVTTAGQVAATN